MRFKYKVKIYYEDTDFSGIVYHANYFKFIERARTELLLSLGVSQKKINLNKGGYFVVKKIISDFLGPSFFEDRLVVISEFQKIKFTSFEINQDIFKGEKKIFKSTIILAYLENGDLTQIPEKIKRVIKK